MIFVLILQFRLVVKTALKLLLVFVEYTESNTPLLLKAINAVDAKKGKKTINNTTERGREIFVYMYIAY